MAYFKDFNLDGTIEEKKDTLLFNVRALNNITQKKNEPKRKELPKKSKRVISTPEPEPIDTPTPKVTEDTEFLTLYHTILSYMHDEDFEKKLYALIDPLDYQLIARLKLQIYHDLVFTSNMAFGEQDINMQDALSLANEYSALLDVLCDLSEEETLDDAPQSQECELYFYENNNKVIFLESLDKVIPTDMYSRVKDLLLNMKKGYFKNRKSLFDRRYLFEVKHGLLRIVFLIVSPTKFLIIDVFMKKVMVSSSYRNQLARYEDAIARFDYTPEIMDGSIKEKHERYFNDIIAFCDSKGRGL